MHDKAIARLRLKIAAVLILKHSLLWLAAWTFVWGTFVIVWRVATQSTANALWLGLMATPLLAVVAGGQALCGMPSRARLRAVVDSASGCGGLLMADALRPIGPWRFSLPKPASLRVRWRGGQASLAFLTGFAFLLLALSFPQSLVTFAAERPFDISLDIQQLAAELDVLKEEAVIDAKRADFLKDRLNQLKNNASGLSPVKTLEALDYLRGIAHKAAREAAESAKKKHEKLGPAQGLNWPPITWSHDNQEEGTRFKEETLALSDLAKRQLTGSRTVDPKANRIGATAGADSAAAQELLPHHRSTVQRYFARPKTTDGNEN